MTGRLLRAVRPSPGDRVLDMACGAGNPAVRLAGLPTRRAGLPAPGGSVLGLGLSASMIDGASRVARAENISNAEFRVVPSELDLRVPDGTFDLATCRVGLQYLPEPAGGLATAAAP